jgi:hypothetical protein
VPSCPLCFEPDGQFVRSAITDISPGDWRQLDTYRCTQCEHEWRAQHQPAESFRPFSIPDFELTEADVV